MRTIGVGLACILAAACGGATQSENPFQTSPETESRPPARADIETEPAAAEPEEATLLGAEPQQEQEPQRATPDLAPVEEPAPVEVILPETETELPPVETKVIEPGMPEPEPEAETKVKVLESESESQTEEPEVVDTPLALPPVLPETEVEAEADPNAIPVCLDGQPCQPTQGRGFADTPPCGTWPGGPHCLHPVTVCPTLPFSAHLDWSAGGPELLGWTDAGARIFDYHEGFGVASEVCPPAPDVVVNAPPSWRLSPLGAGDDWSAIRSSVQTPPDLECRAVVKLNGYAIGAVQVLASDGTGLASEDFRNPSGGRWFDVDWHSTGEEVFVQAVIFESESSVLMQHLIVECDDAADEP